MIRITLKGLAKFMTATPANQRKVLHAFKYPREDGQAQAMYYKDARDLICAKHKHDHPAAWLVGRATQVRQLAMNAVGCVFQAMPISVPKGWRSRFQTDADQHSKVMAITVPNRCRSLGTTARRVR